jgi:hypothetical protein
VPPSAAMSFRPLLGAILFVLVCTGFALLVAALEIM